MLFTILPLTYKRILIIDYVMQLNEDGTYDEIHYEAANGPVRPDKVGNLHINCNVFSSMLGWGKNEGKFHFAPIGSGGRMHVSSRAVMSFPSRFQMSG